MKHYLATTALSETWDYQSNLLLLGPWCLLSRERWKVKKDYFLIPSPWKPALKIKEAADYCHQVYRDLLPEISSELNRIHGTAYPMRYWQVLVGPWLLFFIPVFYDRYRRLKNAINMFPDLYTHVLPYQSHTLSALDTFDFLKEKMFDDVYNFKLLSIISRQLCAQNVVEKELPPEPEMPIDNLFRYNWKTKIFNIFTKKIFSKGKVILADTYHLRNIDKLLINLKSGYREIGFIDFFDKNDLFLSLPALSERLREMINLKGARDKFQQLLYQVIPSAIPRCYIEGFRKYSSYIDSFKGIGQIKILGSAIGWRINEIFKFFAAKAALSGTKLIEFQHGGGYETILSVPVEDAALEKDLFYVWGKGMAKNEKIKYLPSPHLSRLKDTYTYKIDKLLFIGTNFPEYLFQFMTITQPEDASKYLEDKRLFLRNLNEPVKNKFLYRPFRGPNNKYDWVELEVIKDECPNAAYLLNGKLTDYMQKARLVVIDHPGTSLIEALSINAPCLLYWDHDVYLMREEAEEYFALLRDAGILYKGPISAAQKVKEIFNNPLQWWQRNDVQSARNKFCQRYAHNQKNWLEIWVKELKALSQIQENRLRR